MKKILVAGIAAAAFCGAPALAADMPVKAPYAAPVFNWTGFYVGGNGGYGWNDRDPSVGIINNLGATAGPFPGVSAHGGFGGAQLGYNWQASSWVVGWEADIQAADISASSTSTVGANNLFQKKSVDYFGTVRGRLGYAFGQLLVYGTGGFAYGGVHNQDIVNGVANANSSQTKTGYAAGGGFEWALNQVWSAKLEYQHIDLGHTTGLSAPVIPPNGVTIFVSPLNNRFDTVRIGLNYKFATH